MSIRKQNRLAGYDYSQPGAYFITVCTQDRTPVLGTIVGADDYIGPYINLTPIGNVVEKYTQTIPGIGEYIIMPNHVHMILHISATDPQDGPMWSSAPTERNFIGPMWSSAPTDASVENLVRTWKTLITKETGRSIWQRSYYDHIIRDEREYIEIAQYIINNPARWCEDRYYPGY